jgi:hypothetical protein
MLRGEINQRVIWEPIHFLQGIFALGVDDVFRKGSSMGINEKGKAVKCIGEKRGEGKRKNEEKNEDARKKDRKGEGERGQGGDDWNRTSADTPARLAPASAPTGGDATNFLKTMSTAFLILASSANPQLR